MMPIVSFAPFVLFSFSLSFLLFIHFFISASLLPVAAAAICQRYNGASEESTVLLPVAAAANLPAL